MRRGSRVLAVLAVLAVTATGCGQDDEEAQPTPTSGAGSTAAPDQGGTEAQAVTIVGDDYVFSDAPAELEESSRPVDRLLC